MGADAGNIVIGGASAGGHIATLLALRSLTYEVPFLVPGALRGVALFYPAIDVRDEANACVRFPATFPPLRIQRGQSTLAWFFEHAALKGKADLWESAVPLDRIREAGALSVLEWPPTMVVHGEQDAVVPSAISRKLLPTLSDLVAKEGHFRNDDLYVLVPGGRHSYEIAPCQVPGIVFDSVAAWVERQVQGL